MSTGAPAELMVAKSKSKVLGVELPKAKLMLIRLVLRRASSLLSRSTFRFSMASFRS